MNQPMGRVVSVQYYDAGQQLQGDVFRVHIRIHTGELSHQDLPNGNWAVTNPTLQFMALHGLRPSNIDGTYTNVEESRIVVPIAPHEHQDGWGIARDALRGGREALEDAEWFGEGVEVESSQTAQRPPGGPGDDGDGGGRVQVGVDDE